MVYIIPIFYMVFLFVFVIGPLWATASGPSPRAVDLCRTPGCTNVGIQHGWHNGRCAVCQGHIEHYLRMSHEEHDEFHKWCRENGLE